jgi:hypothetical protein
MESSVETPVRSVNKGGRPKGALSWTTRSIQAFCRRVCEDPEYRETVIRRAREGTLGSMEPVILAYAYGRPKESVDLRIGPMDEDFSQLSLEELGQRAAEIASQLKEANALALALDIDFDAREEPQPAEQLRELGDTTTAPAMPPAGSTGT